MENLGKSEMVSHQNFTDVKSRFQFHKIEIFEGNTTFQLKPLKNVSLLIIQSF